MTGSSEVSRPVRVGLVRAEQRLEGGGGETSMYLEKEHFRP